MMSNEMNKHSRATYKAVITVFVFSALIYIVFPAILFLTNAVEIQINRMFIFTVLIVVYLVFMVTRFAAGIYAIMDIITKSFVKERMTYCGSFLQDTSTWAMAIKKSRINICQKDLFHATLANNKHGKRHYRTVFLHSMEQGKSYDVTYGKFSKILLSVTDKNGTEMLHNDE